MKKDMNVSKKVIVLILALVLKGYPGNAQETAKPETVTAFPPQPRKSQMCKCISPRRPGGVANPANQDIPEIESHGFRSCFEFNLVSCPNSHTAEKLGAVFLQKPCSKAPDLQTLEISFVAINEDGYPYGQLAVNKFVRACYDPKSVLKVRTVVHHLDPYEHECPGFTSNQTKYGKKKPKWLSIASRLEAGSAKEPLSVQVMLVDKMKATTPSPSKIFLIAEFTVKNGSKGNPETLRIRTGHLESIEYLSNGQVDFEHSKHVTPTTISLNPVYIMEEVKSIPHKSPCEKLNKQTPKPPGPPQDFMCRCFDWSSPAPPAGSGDDVLKCISAEFNPVTPAEKPPFRFFFSVSKVGGCPGGVEIRRIAITVLVRDSIGGTRTLVAGKWDHASVSTDFTAGKCFEKSPSFTPKPVIPLRFGVAECGSEDRIYTYYKPLTETGESTCGSWEFSPEEGELITEVQAGIKIRYNKSEPMMYTGMFPKIYEIRQKTVKTFEVNLVAEKPNNRTVLHFASPLPQLPCFPTPVSRKTEMCKCINPRRNNGRMLPQDPSLDIPDVREDEDLKACFDFQLKDCSAALGKENIGAVFVQKKCSEKPELITVDIAFIAVNELGYPYGRLKVNQFIRECFTPQEVLQYNPVVHHTNPISHNCSKLFVPNRTLYTTEPEWLSVEAEMSVPDDPDALDAAIQVVFVDQIQTAGKPHPKEIQLIAEFSVIEAPLAPHKVFRIKTGHHKLAFTSAGKVDYAASGAPLKDDIALHPDYMDEQSAGNPSCQLLQPGPASPSPPNPMWLFCRCTDWDSSHQFNVELKECLSVTINNEPDTSKFEFFISLKRDNGGDSDLCGNLTMKEMFFTMLVRDSRGNAGTVIEGSWGKVDDKTDYVSGKCYPKTGGAGGPLAIRETSKFHVQSCDKNPSVNDKKLYYYYKGFPSDGDIICGKWSYSGTTPISSKLEIQVGVKIQIEGESKWKYVGRHPVIYEVIPPKKTGSGKYEMNIVSESGNDRGQLFLPKDPQTGECLTTPFIPSSDICNCAQERHMGFKQNPLTVAVKPVAEADPPIPPDCFELKMVPCTENGYVYDTIGAIFVVHATQQTPGCNVDITVEDVSFALLNENGIPFGEPLYPKFLRSCMPPLRMLEYHVKNIDFANPVGGQCEARPTASGQPFGPAEFMYPDLPSWIAVKTDASTGKMEKSLAVQFHLKRVKGATTTKIQAVAEIVVKSGNTRDLYSVKSKIYSVGYTADGFYDPDKLYEAPVDPLFPNIPPNPEFFEIDKRLATCKIGKAPTTDGQPASIQTCGCFEFTESRSSTRQSWSQPFYQEKFKKCVIFAGEAKVSKAKPNEGVKYFLTIASDKIAEECQDFQVVGVVLTGLKQLYGKPFYRPQWSNPHSQYGEPHGKFERATTTPMTIPSFAEDCPKPLGYTGGLRRPPWDYVASCTRTEYVAKMMYFYFPLMNQPDEANAFCAPWTFPEESSPTRNRFEFQIVGEFFISDWSGGVPVNKYAMKRTQVFEYLPNPPPPTATVTFPGSVFPVADASDDVGNCDTDICLQQ